MDFVLNERFINTLVDCLVLEERQEYLWSWLQLDEEPSFSDYHPSGHERQLWKSRLLLALVMSQARRPMQSESGIDSALKSYFRALDFSSKLKDLPAAFIPASAAGVWLSRIL